MSDPLGASRRMIQVAAYNVGATEAVAFTLERLAFLALIHHVRPDASNAEVRAQAIAAFREIIGRCVAADMDGSFKVVEAGGKKLQPQYCLVTLARRLGRVAGAAAFIVRCRDEAAALQHLATLQRQLGAFREG